MRYNTPHMYALELVLQELYKETRKPHAYAPEWDDEVDRLRVEYLRCLLPLQKRLAELKAQTEMERVRQDAWFPPSAMEYHAIPTADIRLRIAQFLVASEPRQEQMMSQFGWAWRQVQPLRDEYFKDVRVMINLPALFFCRLIKTVF
jgi:hypothetical protein